MADSRLSASLFNVAFTPNNRSLGFHIEGIADISGKVDVSMELIVYGYSALNQKLDPCDKSMDLEGLCPMIPGVLSIDSNLDLGEDVIKSIPGIAYTIPDLDALVRIKIKNIETKEMLACVEAELNNGHTVQQKSVAWVTAIIAGIGLVASAITSGLGHSNTAAHVAANAMSLFGYFQGQALFGMCAMPLPPIVAGWTQNFQWSMGIIRVTFLQRMATWYQRATGGTPTTYLSNLSNTSIEVQKVKRGLVKRGLSTLANVLRRSSGTVGSAVTSLVSRSTGSDMNQRRVVFHGIERVGFRARVETTNIFFTGYTFFVIFVILVTLGVIAFKYLLEALVKAGKLKHDQFTDFRNGWRTVLRGIMYRVILIGFPQMMVLCFWELSQRDSAGEVVLAIFTMVTMIGILGWASAKVIMLAQRSIAMHKNPAYILYSDPVALNKWGFLYVQFKAAAYYFIVPILGYTLIKALFVGVAQGSGKVQAVALVLIEAGLLIGISVMRPYMDKKTNGFNIAIAAFNLLSAIFLLFFSGIFGQPEIVTGAMGVIFFIYNAVFALVLLLMVLVSSGFALFSKNPDTRYQPMRDDRGSFIKSQTQLTTELDALGATARGEGKGTHPRAAIDDDDSFTSSDMDQRQMAAKEGGFTEHYQPAPPRSPVDPSYRAQDSPQAHNNQASYYGQEQQQQQQQQQQYQSYQPYQPPQPYRAGNNSPYQQRGGPGGYDH